MNQQFEVLRFGGARNRTGIGTGLSCARKLATTLRATITPHHPRWIRRSCYLIIKTPCSWHYHRGSCCTIAQRHNFLHKGCMPRADHVPWRSKLTPRVLLTLSSLLSVSVSFITSRSIPNHHGSIETGSGRDRRQC